MPTVVDIEELPITLDLAPIKVGSDYTFTIEIEDDNGDPQNTTGWDMEIAARASGVNGPEIFRLALANGITHTAPIGRFAVKISHDTTSNITVSRLYWDCKIIDSNGDVTFPFEGIWEVKQAVTR